MAKAEADHPRPKKGLHMDKHTFGRARPSKVAGGHALHSSPPRDTHFRDLPDPPGDEPYHLDLVTVISEADYAAIKSAKKLTFHLNGDMGGIKDGMPQQLVAKGMEADFEDGAAASENPAFLYILGDCVYYNGEIERYYAQFYEPYEFYPRPIFAVPGNHDGENLDTGKTLDGFMRNFCQKQPTLMPEAMSSGRTAMTQPNVYWVLRTPVANIVGLYSNVPEGGQIKQPQLDWLIEQLKTLPHDVPFIVTLHHPIYSADDHHSGSTYIKKTLEEAAEQSGRHPDLIFAGHVHNYQRLTKTLEGGGDVPYLVVGAGGYYNLHHVQKVDGEAMITPTVFTDKEGEQVVLNSYTDDHHGFARIEITEDKIVGRYYQVPRPQDPFSKGNQLRDYWEYDWKAKRYLANALR